MADFVMLRKGRNALSTVLHISLNVALAAISSISTIVSGNCTIAILLVVLSKWRVVAVRPRYWWANIKSNLVDFIVGLSFVLLVFLSGGDEQWNAVRIILTILYALWLVAIKPQASMLFAEIQSMVAIFFGSFAGSLITAQVDPMLGCVVGFVIGYGASRHVLMQGDDQDFTLTTFIMGMLLAELSWVFYHWSIVYRISLGDSVLSVPQLPIAASLIFFTFARGYHSALKHDGKIRAEDIAIPAFFSALLMVLMIFLFSKAVFDV